MTDYAIARHPHRDPNGRFLPGCHPGPGRPRGIDVRALVETKMREGFDMADATWQVLEALRHCALGGDVMAAREWLSRVAKKEAAVDPDDRATLEELVALSLETPALRAAEIVAPRSPDPSAAIIEAAESQVRGQAR